MPSTWQWEEQESRQAVVLRDEAPMEASALVGLADKIHSYLNRMCGLALTRLTFQ